MSPERLEAFLARLYVDRAARARFRADPAGEAKRGGLSESQRRALEGIDWVGLELTAQSFAQKRQRRLRRGWRQRLAALLGGLGC